MGAWRPGSKKAESTGSPSTKSFAADTPAAAKEEAWKAVGTHT
jgi:hypothetical protein